MWGGDGGLDQIGFFLKFSPPIAFNNDPPDYENCKEHLPTHLIFTPSLHYFQPSMHKHKTLDQLIYSQEYAKISIVKNVKCY